MKGEVFITGTPQRAYVRAGEKVRDFHILLSLQTRESDKDSPPLRLSVVLDKSGSMAGAKLKWGLRAIRKIVKHLRPKDTFHLVCYDTNVQVVFEKADLTNKNRLDHIIKNIKAGSCTNLSGGLKRGFDLLLKNTSESDDVKPIKRIFLFSDGQANVGIRKHEEMFDLVKDINSKGVTITSFGIGNDFDERMMKGIAEHGKGKYLFLEPSTITKQVSKAIHGLMDMIGTEALFRFTEHYGTEISRMYANELDSATEYQVGDLNGDNLKMILIQLNLSCPKKLEESQVDYKFLSYEFEYISKKLKGEKVTIKNEFRLSFSEDETLLSEESQSVFISKQIQNAADQNQEILNLVELEKMDEALGLKKKIIEDLEKIEDDDGTGHVKLILTNERESLKKLEEQKNNPRLIKKQIGYDRYRARALSTCCLRSGFDSDEENWSDEDNNNNNTSQPPLQQQQRSTSPVRRRRRRHSGRRIGISFPPPSLRAGGVIQSQGRSRSRSRSRSPPRRVRGRRLSGDGQMIGNNQPIYLGRRNRSMSPGGNDDEEDVV